MSEYMYTSHLPIETHTITFAPRLKCQTPHVEIVEPYKVNITFPKLRWYNRVRVRLHLRTWQHVGLYRTWWDRRMSSALPRLEDYEPKHEVVEKDGLKLAMTRWERKNDATHND